MRKDDALNYLPSTRIMEFPRRCVIYQPGNSVPHLYLVLSGRVKVFCTANSGAQTLICIREIEEFFGQSAILPCQLELQESAVALDSAQVMSWTGEEVQERIEKEPRLALALSEYFGAENLLLRERIITMAKYKTGPRVALGLLQLSRSNGETTPMGARRLTGLTHQVIADYVGTSREIVTTEMNRLRRLGYLTYSRLYTDVHDLALAEWMGQQTTGAHTGMSSPLAAA
jgi:CRP/FNR family cyclic AMP-dependent transcriptional regulator